MNNSGKVLTVFLVIIAIILVSLTAISMFFFLKEIELRKVAEENYQEVKAKAEKFEIDLKDAQKKVYLLEEKEKESDEKINGLMDELNLEQGLREEMKQDNQDLKDSLEKQIQLNETLRSDVSQYKVEVANLEVKLASEASRIMELEAKVNQLQDNRDTKEPTSSTDDSSSVDTSRDQTAPDAVEQKKGQEGTVLSVDGDNNFLIFNLGQNHGMTKGMVMSVYRSKKHLGDVQVTRVQSEMAAADFIPPLSGRQVRKGDRIIPKQ